MSYKYCVVWSGRTHAASFNGQTRKWRLIYVHCAKMFCKLRTANTFKNAVCGKVYELVVL